MPCDTTSRPRVLVTGAAGRVFTGVEPMLRRDRQYVLTDLTPSRDDIAPLDLLDYPAVRAAMDGIDIVLHMAIYSKQKTPDITGVPMDDRQIEVNVLGTQHVMEAAHQAGVKHFAYMSSMTVLIGRPSEHWLDRDAPICPSTIYGVTKLFGEQLGEVYARLRGMSVTCMRLGQPIPMDGFQFGSTWIAKCVDSGIGAAYGDIARAVNVSLELREPGWRAFRVLSWGRRMDVDFSDGEALGFTPRQKITADGIIDLPESPTMDARNA